MGMVWAVVSWGIRPACLPVYGLPRSMLKKLAGYDIFIGSVFEGPGLIVSHGVRGGHGPAALRALAAWAAWRLACPGVPAAGRNPVPGAGQVASTQAPPCRVRPLPIRFRRFSAAVRHLSQAWFLATPR